MRNPKLSLFTTIGVFFIKISCSPIVNRVPVSESASRPDMLSISGNTSDSCKPSRDLSLSFINKTDACELEAKIIPELSMASIASSALLSTVKIRFVLARSLSG